MSANLQTSCSIPDKLNQIVATTAKSLATCQKMIALSVLCSAEPTIEHAGYDNWNGGTDLWVLHLSVPVEVFYSREDISDIENEINDPLSVVMRAISNNDCMNCRIHPYVEGDPDWRRKARQFLSSEGMTNQGRVRSDNIAARQYDGLLFRSKQEILVYNALKREGVPFAPLPVVLRGGLEYRRTEPDFVIFRDGMVMIVEIDGDSYHNESPAAADARLKLLSDEGVRVKHIRADSCDTAEKAREAVQLVLRTIDKLRGAL